jgi:hypothetical protein
VRATNCLSVSVSLLLLFSAVCAARLVRPWLPEELEPKATLICNGTVLSVEETGIKKDFLYPDIAPSWHQVEMVMLAKIKVLHAFKGQAPAIIEFRYRVLAPSPHTTVVCDGPDHVNLQKDGRYRFFLKPDDLRGGYVSVLEGNYDDNFAVEALTPTEPDDSPYLKKDDAVQFALDRVHSKEPDEKFDLSRIHVACYPEVDGGATWAVMLFDTGDSTVFVCADHTINEKLTKLNERHGD